MVEPKRKRFLQRQRQKRREDYRGGRRPRPGETTASTRPAAERKADSSRAAEEARLLRFYNKAFTGSEFGKMTPDDLRKWSSLSDAERDDLRRACWSGGESELAKQVARRIGLPVGRIHELATA